VERTCSFGVCSTSAEVIMARLSEQLIAAVRPNPPDPNGFIVKLVRLTHEDFPGRDAQAILPVFVVGHEEMAQRDWVRWLKEHATECYGSAYAAKLAETGVDVRDLMATAPLGRVLRTKAEGTQWNLMPLERAAAILTMVERWPSLYNLMAEEMADEEMTLRTFTDKVYAMPAPWEIGRGRYYTLGDLISRLVVVTPAY
jgi:hypothetical protein